MKKKLLLIPFLLGPLLFTFGQKKLIEFDLKELHPTHQVSGNKTVQINVVSSPAPNLLKQYDANPFEKPVIATESHLQQCLSSAFTEYLSNIGLQSQAESENQINLKSVICAINFLSGKGWKQKNSRL